MQVSIVGDSDHMTMQTYWIGFDSVDIATSVEVGIRIRPKTTAAAEFNDNPLKCIATSPSGKTLLINNAQARWS